MIRKGGLLVMLKSLLSDHIEKCWTGKTAVVIIA